MGLTVKHDRLLALARLVWEGVKSVDVWRVHSARGELEAGAVFLHGDVAVLDIDSVPIGRALPALRAALLQLVTAAERQAWLSEESKTIRELIERSSLGEAVREMKEAPEKHLAKLDAELLGWRGKKS